MKIRRRERLVAVYSDNYVYSGCILPSANWDFKIIWSKVILLEFISIALEYGKP